MTLRSLSVVSVITLAALALGACRKAPPELVPAATVEAEPTPPPAAAPSTPPPPTAETGFGSGAASAAAESAPAPSAGAAEAPAAPKVALAKPLATVPVSPDDPLKGVFTLADAVKDLPAEGTLVAELSTDQGKLECELYEDRAPITVANFVGLARGLRPFKGTDGSWAKKPGYDGTTFHRVIKGFMIQGGDPQGTGGGEPGYVIPDEIWVGAKHNQRGQLCMANRGPNTNGMQFFIMDGVANHLDGGYTIFGMCTPETVIDKLSSVEVQGDHSLKPSKITKVTVKRKPAAAKKPAAK